MGSAGGHAVQHVPAFVPRLAETARSQPFEVPNSLLSQSHALAGAGPVWRWPSAPPSTASATCTPGSPPKARPGPAYGVPAAARYLTWLAEHADYGLSDIEAEVAAHATARTGEPTEETEPSPNGPDDGDGPAASPDEDEPARDSADPGADQDQASTETS